MNDNIYDHNSDPNLIIPPWDTDLEDVVERLRNVLYNGGSAKHTPYIIARKEVVFRLLDSLTRIVSSMPKDTPKSCSECPLKRHDEDLRIAHATIDRLAKGDTTVTRDEAINLSKMFVENYKYF